MRRSVSACVVAGALLLASATAASAGSPGLNGKLIYRSSGGTTVSDADPLTSDTTILGPGDAYDPAWSPDGTRYVVARGGDIWVYAANGTGGHRITHGSAYDETPSWSPDGARVVFGRPAGSKEYIAVVSANGGTVKQLSHPATHYFDYAPVWSPDGTRIAFNRDKNHGTSSYDIWIMKFDGTGAKAWISDGIFNGFPAWSPDSTKLAYEQKVSGHTRVRIRKVSGGTVTTLSPSTGYEPEWSPDGKWIIVGNGSGGLVKVKSTGGAATLVTSDGSSPSWQPLCNNIYSAGVDHVTGTSKAELLCGGGGNDVIDGGGNSDIIFGGAGKDTLKGGGGNDVLVGGADNDTFNGGAGKDTCVQGAGSGSKAACEY
jgi:Tol biopolymer transport system component